MTKKEIMGLSNEELFVRMLNTESSVGREVNRLGRVTRKTQRAYKWLVEECCSRFNLDEDSVIKNIEVAGWWNS